MATKEEKQTEEISSDIEQEAISLVRQEWKAYEYSLVFVTDKVAFNIRSLVKSLRKNYWGIFDKERDTVTGKKLTWIPLTEWICDTWTKNADKDSKDIQVKAKNGKAIGITSIVRHIVKNWLDNNIFGETLDDTERQLAIDGSHIWKTFEGVDKKGKKTLIRKDVDILNAYFDMTQRSIQDAYRFTERGLLTVPEIEGMDGWMNIENIEGSAQLHPTDTDLVSVTPTGSAQFIDIWETWGLIPKRLITSKKGDNEEIEGHIVVSGLQGKKQSARVHLIETNPKGLKPYEEVHTKRVLGRWLGRGPAEAVMMLQSWLNMLVNIRKFRHQISQLGIFKLKKTGGVSRQNLSRMAVNGVLTVNNMDDIEQMVMQEASQSSYSDEDSIVNWAQRVTSAYDSVTGEEMPSSQTATNTVVQKRSSDKTYEMARKAIGFFLERWLKRHAIPILNKTTSVGEIIRMTGDIDELKTLDIYLVNYFASKAIDKGIKEGKIYDEIQIAKELENAVKKLRNTGRERYIEIIRDIDLTEYDILVFTDEQKLDVGVMVNNLINILKIAPEYRDPTVRRIFDIMGLDVNQLENEKLANPQQQQPEQGQAGQEKVTNPTEQQQVTKANVPV